MVANILPVDVPPPITWGWGQEANIQLFQNMVMLHIKSKGMTNAATCNHIFCPYTPPQPLGGVKAKTFFPESSHVAYQIKVNGTESTMHAHILSLQHHRPLGWAQTVKTFFLLKVVMLHIKFKGMDHRAPCKHIVCPFTHTQSPDGVKRSKHFLSVNSHVVYQIKGNGT